MSIFENSPSTILILCSTPWVCDITSIINIHGRTLKTSCELFVQVPFTVNAKEESEDQREKQLPSNLTSTLRCGEQCFQLVLFPADSKVSLDKTRLI